MIIQPYEIVEGNYGVSLNFVVVDGQNNIVNLTGASLVLKVQDAQDPNSTDLTLGGSITIDSPTAGTCHYTVANGDFPNPGTFRGQIDITPQAGGLISCPGITIIVIPGLPRSNN